MNTFIEWQGPQATITRMEPLGGVTIDHDDAFDGRRVTGFQFLVTASGSGALYVDLSRVVAAEDKGRAGFVRHNASLNKWETVPFTEEGERYRIPSRGGLYALTLNVLSESRYVDDAVSTFPGWFAGVMDRNSNLRQLANIPASIFEDISEGLSEALRRSRLDSIPAEVVHETLRYEMDGLEAIEDLEVSEERMGQEFRLIVSEELADLYYDPVGRTVLLDRKRAVIHRLQGDHPLRVTGKIRGEAIDIVLKGEPVAVFNEFDEIGLQFGLPRLKGESNIEYRNRIRTLFSHPGNATKYGILREVARRTGNFKTVKWMDPSRPIVLSNPSGMAFAWDDVSVDGVIVETRRLPDGGAMIPPTNSKSPHEVVFHTGVETYTLGASRLNEHGQPSAIDMESYERWRSEAPVLYDGIRFDRQEWDMVDEKSLIELMPRTDTTLEGWE